MKMKLKTSQEFQNSRGRKKKKEVIIIHKYYLIKSHLIYKREYI